MSRSTLKKSLLGWTGFPEIKTDFQPQRTRKAAAEAKKVLEGSQPRKPKSYDLVVLHRRITQVWRRDHSLAKVTHRDLRRMPWVLFYSPPTRTGEESWLGADPHVIAQYGQWLSEGRKSRSVRSLLHEFLRVYPTQLRTFQEIRQLLLRLVTQAQPPMPPSMQKWQERCCDFDLLEDNGCTVFLKNMISTNTSEIPDVHAILDRAGLSGSLARCDFLRTGILTYLPKFRMPPERNRLATVRLNWLLALLEMDGKLRFDGHSVRSKIASALLGPFVTHPAETEIRRPVERFFRLHFGDPRLPYGKSNWGGIPEEIRRVVIRWRVERVLDQFLTLIEETALDKHWRYRRAFWQAFRKQNLIDDIWVVLGRRPRNMWKKMEYMNGEIDRDGQIEEAAILEGAQNDQSVLLLRVPGVTIAEWSHNGSCRFWLDGAPGAPQLYKNSYHRNALMGGADFSQRHDGSIRGRWQDYIAKWLDRNTGIQVDRRDYFPSNLREETHPLGRYRFRDHQW